MSMDLIIEDSAPGVRLLRLNRSASLNALSGALLSAMADELQRVEADEVVRCVVLTGDERAFSAGADLKEMPSPICRSTPKRTASRLGRQSNAFPSH